MAVGVPDRDFGKAPHPAAPGFQVAGTEPAHQPDDDVSACAQVIRRLGLAHLGGLGRMLRVKLIDQSRVDVGALPGENLPHPSGQVLVRVRDVIYDNAHRPWIAVKHAGMPVIGAAAFREADETLAGRGDLGCVRRRALRLRALLTWALLVWALLVWALLVWALLVWALLVWALLVWALLVWALLVWHWR